MNTTKDLTVEKFYSDGDSTTLADIKALSKLLLTIEWTIDIYRHSEPQTFNLHDLGWTFEFNNRKRARGVCSSRKKTIYISKWLLEQNLDQASSFENTIRHEIAHAIDNEMRGESDHSNIWKAIARQVLCTAERCTSGKLDTTKNASKYSLVCPDESCDYVRASHKKRKVNAKSYPCCSDYYNSGKGYVRLEQVQNF